MTEASRVPQTTSRHRVRSSEQNTPETHPSRSTTQIKSVLSAGGTASTSFVVFPLSHPSRGSPYWQPPPIVRLNHGTDVPVLIACAQDTTLFNQDFQTARDTRPPQGRSSSPNVRTKHSTLISPFPGPQWRTRSQTPLWPYVSFGGGG